MIIDIQENVLEAAPYRLLGVQGSLEELIEMLDWLKDKLADCKKAVEVKQLWLHAMALL